MCPPEILTNRDDNLDAILRSHNGLATAGQDMPANLASMFDVLGRRADRYRAYAESTLYNMRPRNITFGFVDENGLNALAYAAAGTGQHPFDFIGINVGAPLTLLVNFRQMLARPQVLPDVGNAGLEVEGIPPLDTLTTNAVADRADAAEPQCPVRYIFAQHLATVAFDFLFFHEMTHLRNGHLELWNQRGMGRSLLEVAPSVAGESDDRLRRTIEADADCGGLQWTLNAAHGDGRSMAQRRANFTSDAGYEAALAMWGTKKLVTRSTTFAIYVLCRLFHEAHQARPPQSSEPYPSPPVRLRVMTGTVRALLAGNPDFYGFDPDSFESDQNATIEAAEAACANICGRNPNVHQMTEAANAEFLAFNEEFEQTWAQIRPELEQFKRGGNLAP